MNGTGRQCYRESQPPLAVFNFAHAGRASKAAWVCGVSFSEPRSCNGPSAVVMVVDRPDRAVEKDDGSFVTSMAFSFAALAVKTGPAVCSAVTTLLAKAGPPLKVGGARSFNFAAVSVNDRPKVW